MNSVSDIKKYSAYVFYAAILFAFIPVVRYFYFLLFDPYTRESSFFISVRVYLSAPLMIFAGIILLLFYKNYAKYIGWASLIIGVSFLGILIKAILEEAQVL